jgi:hypothetical protein
VSSSVVDVHGQVDIDHHLSRPRPRSG